MEGGFEQRQNLGPEFADHVHETLPRDGDGAAGPHYTNQTGRNDIVAFNLRRHESWTVVGHAATKMEV